MASAQQPDVLRLDVAMAKRALMASRQKAQQAIADNLVYVNGKLAGKPSIPVGLEDQIEIRGETLRYVSRGGLKLERALERFDISLQGAVAMDCGASTGGFTDCMLQNGARRVFAVDVGHDQLAPKLRQDERVVSLEGVNARHLTREQIPEPLDFVSIDVSFISLDLILPAITPLLGTCAQVVCLIKPQFEAGAQRVGKKGVVRDGRVHVDVIQKVFATAGAAGYQVRGLTHSPIRGPEGNIEYLGWLVFDSSLSDSEPIRIEQVVSLAHSLL